MKYNIFHLDMDCFFASIEEKNNNIYKKIPMVVGGTNGKGVVASANKMAKNIQIKSGMKIYQALNIFPKLKIENCKMDLYKKISDDIYNYLKMMFKYVEIGSIDEWFIDTNDSQFENWNEQEFASFLKNQIYKKFDLSCTIGCSWNKFLAKTSTNISKKNNFTLLTHDNFQKIIGNLTINQMHFVGKKTASILNEYNIKKIGDLYNINPTIDFILYKKIGINWINIKNNALGYGKQKIQNHIKQKTIEKSRVVKNLSKYSEFKEIIVEMVNSLNKTLKNMNYSYTNILMKIYFYNKKNANILIKNNESNDFVSKKTLLSYFNLNIDNSVYSDITKVAISLSYIQNNSLKFEQLNFLKNNEDSLNDLIVSVNNKLNKNILFKSSILKKL